MSGSAATILIVDDEPHNRKLLETFLQPEGYLTRTATNGDEALAAVAQQAPDLILLDVMMPGMDGYQVIAALKANPATSSIPVIMVTALTDRAARLAGLKAGAQEFLTKPIDRAELWLRVRNLLSLKAYTDHLQNQGALLEQQVQERTVELHRFRAAMEISGDAIVLVDRASMRYIDVNQTFCNMVGYTRQELIGMTPMTLFSVGREILERDYDAIIADPNSSGDRIEGHYHHRDGSLIPIETRRRALHTDAGWIIVGTARDITERKQAAEELQNSETRFRQMADNISDVFYLRDADGGRMLYVSRAYEEIWGRSRDSLYADAKSWSDAIHPDDRAATSALNQQGVLAGKYEFEYRIVRPDGSIRWIETKGYPVLDAAGKTVRIAGVAEDITERKQASDDLRASERRFRDLLGNVELISLMLDREARITYCNDYFLRLTGWRREDVIGRDWFDVFTTGDAGEMRRIFASLLADQPEARHRDNEVVTRTGERRLIRWSNSLLRSGSGEVVGTASIGEDVTEQRLAEDRIKRLNRVYSILSGINDAIVRTRGREELYREACRIAVSAGGFLVARVIEMDAKGWIRIAATSEASPGPYQRLLDEYNRDPANCQNLLGLALRSRQAQVANDVAGDRRIPERVALTKGGNYALALLPMIINERVVGAFVLRAQVGSFNETELKLLAEVVANLSFALDHIEKQDKLDRTTRVNALLSGINAAIVRIRDREELFAEVCRIAVETGGLAFAWLSVVDEAEAHLRPVAHAGDGEGFLEAIRARLSLRDDAPEGHGIGAKAVRELRALAINDVASATDLRHKKLHAERGIKSVAAFPLVIAGRAVGAFALHAAEAGFFDDDEMKLLNEVAANIAFALEHIEKEAKVQRLTRVYAVLSGINALIVRAHTRDELFSKACQIAVDEGGFRMAWIGIVDRDAMRIVPMASAGANAGFLADTRKWLSLTDDPAVTPGPSVMAVRSKQPIVVDEVAADLRMRGRSAHLDPGVRSLVILPLLIGGEVVAVFGLHTLETGYFDATEMKLLRELGGDIAFAIDHIDKQEQLEYLAYYDELTGLANRRLFLERVAQYVRSAEGGGHKLAVFLVDLERFKNINDSLGQASGDALLKQVAQWLTLNAGDASLVARIAADHFALVLPKVRREGGVARLVEKTQAAFLEHTFRLDSAVFRIGAKVGAALYPDDGANADVLLKNAEAALKLAKSGNEKFLFHTQKMTEKVAGKLTLENQLRQALDKNEFVLHYQPKVSLANGRLTSAEALIRWNDPRTGLVPPGQFIPILEETGLIYEVGRWALRQALADYLRWHAAGLPAVRIAVNVSPLQLRNRGFIAEIRDVIGIHAQAAAGLELEITESLIMEDVKHSITSLQAIRAMGLSIAIDDFGTGFSSLSHLARLPVDTLKIDRSFVIDMTGGPQGLALVSTIINLAHSLKLKVVAEGVETEEQSRLLRLLGCDEMQGYLFSKPVPGEVFEAKYLAQAPAEVSLAA
jgi:diguanylate cyclase (GGDEF)-like protein/PAS domain S-box-containing protein